MRPCCHCCRSVVHWLQSEMQDEVGMLKRNLPPVPRHLEHKVAGYEAMCAASENAWPPYAQMLVWLRDTKLTLEMIGRFVGVSRERMRQVCNEDFPSVRKRKKRRHFGNRSHAASRERAEEQFKSRSKVYALLTKHQVKDNFCLQPVWGAQRPLARVVRYNGKRHYVMWLRSALLLSGSTADYAHAAVPSEESLRHCHGLLVVLDINDGLVNVSRLYRITLSTFRQKQQTHVLIRITERRREQQRRSLIAWERHLVSSLD
jgi:hypothetical protein